MGIIARYEGNTKGLASSRRFICYFGYAHHDEVNASLCLMQLLGKQDLEA